MGVGGGRGFCPYCGAMNPASFNFCGTCHRALPAAEGGSPSLGDVPRQDDPFQPNSSSGQSGARTFDISPRVGGLVFVYISIGLIIGGIGFLAGGAVESASAASFNHTCSSNPQCTPVPDFSGVLYALGAVVLIIGIALLVYGIRQYTSQD